jgi:hypothetical protein
MFSMSSPVLVSDKYIEKILIATSLKPMTATDVSKAFGIPIAVCNSKMKMLEGLGLIKCSKRVVASETRTVNFYSAMEDRVKVSRDDGRYVVKIDVPLGVALDISLEWHDFVA